RFHAPFYNSLKINVPKNKAWPRPAAGSPLDSNIIKCAPAGLGTTPENAYLSCVKRPDLLTTCRFFNTT
uniref:hypothetical protein n=1 Tax=Candidatus Cryptobacteroides bacterium TaxID=3085639 RepID=UPI003FF08403